MFLFVQIHSRAIGHAVRDFESIQRKVDAINSETGSKKIRALYYPMPIIANYAWIDLIKANYCVIPFRIGSLLHRICMRFSASYLTMHKQVMFYSNADGEFAESFSQPLFCSGVSKEDIRDSIGNHFFDSKYVCLIVRDSGYDEFQDTAGVMRQKYRITPTSHFVDPVKILIENGFNVIRMGRHTTERIPFESKNYLELTEFIPRISEELELAIFQHSSFAITTGSGPDCLVSFFRRPLFRINVAPIHHLLSGELYPFTLISDYIHEPSGKKVSFNDLFKDSKYHIEPEVLQRKYSIAIKPKSARVIQELVSCAVLLGHENEPVDSGKLTQVLHKNQLYMDSRRFIY